MKECKYINCNKLHDNRSDYCKPSHKTRQWEINKGKQNPIVQKRPKRSPSRLSGSNKRNISHSIARAEIFAENPNNSVSQSPRYYSELVPRPATFNATKLAIAIASVNEIRKPSRRRNVSNVGKALVYGFAADLIWNLLRGNTTEILHEIPMVPETVAAPSVTRVRNQSGPLINALDYRKQKIDTINFDRQYRQLLGKPPKDFYMMVHGESGHGKSYWAIQFAEYFKRNHGKVLYFAAEQRGMNLAVQNILNEVQATFEVHTEPRNLTISEIKSYANKYDLLVFDSFTEMDLQPDEIKEIRKTGKAAILGVLQSTKDGKFKGDNTWLHDTDIMVQLVNRVANTEQKARYEASEPKVLNINVNS